MDSPCTKCSHYARGSGEPACLKCNRYRYILTRSQSVKLAPSPPKIIIEHIPNPERLHNIFKIIATLETRDASILMLYYLADRSMREIARLHKISHQMVDKILKQSIEKIRINLTP